ncbi:MAG: SPOR domain-containing protein [Methylococcales bacterium]
MDPNLKQRLVGATILSALAVIFVPMIFEDSGSNPGTLDFAIPEVPAQLEQNPPDPAQRSSDAELAMPPVPALKPIPDESTPANPGEEKQPSLRSWIIQVGSFSKRENADSLRDQLRQSGYPAYVEIGTGQGTPKFRVRAGPELDRQRAVNLRNAIALKFNVKGIVLPIP